MKVDMDVKCPKCKSENVRLGTGGGRQSGNQWFEPYVCKDCGNKFELSEEIKVRGN